MHPLILVGFDLVVSAVLILMAMYVVWNRVQSRLNTFANKGGVPPASGPDPDSKEQQNTSKEEASGEWAFGGITKQAATLKQKGCSLEQIAQRLQLPTREVEMVLAMSEMAKTDGNGHRLAAPFSLEPEAIRPV